MIFFVDIYRRKINKFDRQSEVVPSTGIMTIYNAVLLSSVYVIRFEHTCKAGWNKDSQL